MERVDVAIVGAGAAGLAAARDLARAGCRIAILEARGRIGGRILTRAVRGVSLPVELGAEFLHDDPEQTLAILDEAGDVAVAVRGEQREARGRRIVRSGFERHIAAVMERIPRRGADRSFAAFLADAPGGRRMAKARATVARFVQGFHTADLNVIGMKAMAPSPGDDPAETAVRVARASGGLACIADTLARGLAPAIRLESPVSGLQWSRRGVELEIAGGRRRRRLKARAAIVTVPIAVLAAPAGARGTIAIEPRPRRLDEALAGIAMGRVVKLVFAFRELPWAGHRALGGTRPQDVTFLHVPGDFNVWWSSHPVRGPLVTAWSGGPPAAALSRLPAGARFGAAVGELARALGVSPRRIASRIAGRWTHDWVGDPWTRGSYTYLRVGGEGAGRRLARLVGGVLAFAGEATAEDQAGTVEGAIVSGRRAARQVRRALG